MSQEFDIFNYWLQAELVVFFFVLFANLTFLFFRSLVCQKLEMKIAALMQGANTDYLESQAILSGIYTTFIVPAGVLFFIREICSSEGRLAGDPAAGIAGW